jgi:hypothetical protein
MREGMDLNKFSLFLDGGWAVRYPLGPARGGHVGVWAFTLMGLFGLSPTTSYFTILALLINHELHHF